MNKANYIGTTPFHNESTGNYGYEYTDLNTSENFEIFWTDNSSVVYSKSLSSIYNLTNMVPVDDTGNFSTQVLTPGTYNFSIKENEVYLLKKEEATAVQENDSDNLLIFPNPTNGKIFININTYDKIELTDITGRRVLSTTTNRDIDINNYPNGIYIVRIITNNQFLYYKVIKQ